MTDSGIDNTALLAWTGGMHDGKPLDDAATVQLDGRFVGEFSHYKYLLSDVMKLDGAGNWVVPPTGSGSFYLTGYDTSSFTRSPIVISDVIPDGFTITGIRRDVGSFGETPDCVIDGQTVTCTYDAHPIVTTYSELVSVIVDVAWSDLPPDTYPNTATLTDGDGRTATGSLTVDVPQLDLGITKTTPLRNVEVPAGAYVPFTVIVTNNGGTPVTDPLRFVDQINSSVEVVSATGEGWTCSPGPAVACTSDQDLAPGARSSSVTILTRAKTRNGGSNTVVLVPPDGDQNPNDDYASTGFRGSRAGLVENPAIATRMRGRLTPGSVVDWGRYERSPPRRRRAVLRCGK